uniref:Angiotensin-converting enzyme n=1 Tax=Glossina austeni TaxID=7395 RepID=A0A1A9VXA6_GLOAU
MKILFSNSRDIFILFITLSLSTSLPHSEVALQKFLDEVNNRLAIVYNRNVLANWQTEIKGANDLVALLQSEVSAQDIMRYISSISSKVKFFKNQNITSENWRRQLSLLPQVGYEILPREDLEFLHAITSNLTLVYKNAKLCSFQNREQCNLTLVPDIQNILKNSKNVLEIEYYWREKHRKTALTNKEDFQTLVDLYRKTAKLNEYIKEDDEKPLDLCDLSQKAIVGEKLRQVMSLGSSKPPKEIIKILFGKNEISMNGLLAYYKPLNDWFFDQNRLNYYEIGWQRSESEIYVV